jgi:hypothetical protein
MTTAEFDLTRYNYKALLYAIVAPRYVSPDKAINVVGMPHGYRTKPKNQPKRYNYTDQDLEEVIRLRKQGATWKEVGKLYNIDPKSLFDIVKRYKKRRNIA